MKILELKRTSVDGDVTRGTLFIDGSKYADTIEPAPHWCKGPIPAATYPVWVTYSPKFKKYMAILEGVPGFTGIRIHTGTRAEHTQGCICINMKSSTPLANWIEDRLLDNEKVFIRITNPAAGLVR